MAQRKTQALSSDTPLVLFERIRAFHRPVIWYHLRRGATVRVFDFTQNLKRRRWLRRLINAGRVERIYIDPLDTAHTDAIDTTNTVADTIRCRARRVLTHLLQDPQADLVLKKALLPDIFECLFVDNALQRLPKTSSPPVLYCETYLRYRSLIARNTAHAMAAPKTVRVPWWQRLAAPVMGLCDTAVFKLVRLTAALLQVLLLAAGKVLCLRRPGPLHFRHAVLIEQKFQLALKGKRYFDFILDRKDFTTDNTAFCFRMAVSPEVAAYCRQRNYTVLDLTQLGRPQELLRANPPWRTIARALRTTLSLAAPLAGPLVCMQAAVRSGQVFIEQTAMDRLARFDHYLYANQEHPKQLAINILLRKRGTHTWNYTLAVGGSFLYATDRKEDFRAKRHILWAYLNSDHYVAVCPDAVTYHRLHNQAVGAYHDVGGIYSQLVDEYRREQPQQVLRQELFGRSLPTGTPVVACFDTTYVYDEQAVTTFQHAMAFYRDILRLLEDFPALHVIIKPAKTDSYFTDPTFQWSHPSTGREILDLWDRLKASPRVCWAGTGADVSAIIAAADVTVTDCMSSPTFEALGAACKAVWYDSNHRAEGILFDRAVGLICHGYDQWHTRIKELLATNEADYRAYLDAHVRGTIESYLDSRGLDRFRALVRNA